uniref:Uncharacterized protein n=1 Tax=viral metagenome TaxID=1070528 RepID=A0A6C0J5N1_9ZZZZ
METLVRQIILLQTQVQDFQQDTLFGYKDSKQRGWEL